MITHSRLHKLLFYKITMYLTALNDDSKYITAAQISALKIFFGQILKSYHHIIHRNPSQLKS